MDFNVHQTFLPFPLIINWLPQASLCSVFILTFAALLFRMGELHLSASTHTVGNTQPRVW